MAAPSLPSVAANPAAELAGSAGKVKQAADKVGDALPDARKGALAPDVEGQRRECSVFIACSAANFHNICVPKLAGLKGQRLRVLCAVVTALQVLHLCSAYQAGC